MDLKRTDEKEKIFLAPVTFFELSDGFLVLYNYPMENFQVKIDEIGISSLADKNFYLRFSDENGSYNFVFPIEFVFKFIQNKKFENLKFAFYNLKNIATAADYLTTIVMPMESIYEIKGAVELAKREKIVNN